MPTPLPKTSAPAGRALDAIKVKNLEDLVRLSEADVAKLHGMGARRRCAS